MIPEPQKPTSGSRSAPGVMYINGEKYPLPDQVIKNIEAIIGFQSKQEQNIPIHEQVLEKITTFFGKPQFLYFQILFFVSWWLCSHLVADSLPWNLLKFDLEGMGIDVASLLIATGVLVQQTRQDKLAEQRSHLMLQINLLTEQKIAKLIELLEELRTDLPSVPDRYDWEAEMMQQATDPQVVLNILQENLEQSSEEDQTHPEAGFSRDVEKSDSEGGKTRVNDSPV